MTLHLQTDWQRTLGQHVEVRRKGKAVRTGTVEEVMPDNSPLHLFCPRRPGIWSLDLV
jgi:hypothetical protein